jgi:hypothetical protein
MCKRKFRDSLRSKTDTAQKNEALALQQEADREADHARQTLPTLEEIRTLSTTIRDASAEHVRNTLAGLVEKITLFFEYGRPRTNGNRPAVFTAFEVQRRPEATGLLGEKLRQSARSTT